MDSAELLASIDTFLDMVYEGSLVSKESSSSSLNLPQTSAPRRRPFVTLTYAQSLDAKIGVRDGRQLILSGKESMMMTHRLRARHSAILVGIGTVLNDDPQLNCRIPELLSRDQQPRPYILDTDARTPLTCRLIKNAQSGIGRFPVICIRSSDSEGSDSYPGTMDRARALEQAGCRTLRVPHHELGGRKILDFAAFLKVLQDDSARDTADPTGKQVTLMVEGGARVISSVLEGALFDRLVVTIAPTLVGSRGVSVTESWDTETIATSGTAEEVVVTRELPKLEHIVSTQLGRDTVFACRTGSS